MKSLAAALMPSSLGKKTFTNKFVYVRSCLFRCDKSGLSSSSPAANLLNSVLRSSGQGMLANKCKLVVGNQ